LPLEQVNIYQEVAKQNDLSKRTNEEIIDLAKNTAVTIAKNQALRDDNAILHSAFKAKQIAEESSNYYKQYKDTKYITLNDKDWANLYAEYDANLNIYGKEYADN
jgi:uncharacterized membrane protein YcgQ (UPF0703/DUF1980 family)